MKEDIEMNETEEQKVNAGEVSSQETQTETQAEMSADPAETQENPGEEDGGEGEDKRCQAESGKKEGSRKFFKKKDEKKKADAEMEALNAKVAEMGAKLAETNDKYIRLAAEFDNFRRRTAKERLELISTAGEDVLKGILPTLDDCEKALAMLSKLEGCDAAVEGTKLIYDKLMAYLKSRGVTRIEAMGADFDTDLHEAVAQFPVQEEEKKNKVIDVTRQGYMLKDKVIRFAQVVVGI